MCDPEVLKRAQEWFDKKNPSATLIHMSVVTDRKNGIVDNSEYNDVSVRVIIEYRFKYKGDLGESKFVNYTECDEAVSRERNMAFSNYE